VQGVQLAYEGFDHAGGLLRQVLQHRLGEPLNGVGEPLLVGPQ
jgi:hypothetical protein